MILSAVPSQAVTRPSSPKGLARIYKAIAVIFMPQVSSAYAFLALSIALGIEKTSVYLLFSILFGTLVELCSLLVYARFLKRDASVQDREDRPILFAVAIISYLVGFTLLRYLEAP